MKPLNDTMKVSGRLSAVLHSVRRLQCLGVWDNCQILTYTYYGTRQMQDIWPGQVLPGQTTHTIIPLATVKFLALIILKGSALCAQATESTTDTVLRNVVGMYGAKGFEKKKTICADALVYISRLLQKQSGVNHTKTPFIPIRLFVGSSWTITLLSTTTPCKRGLTI